MGCANNASDPSVPFFEVRSGELVKSNYGRLAMNVTGPFEFMFEKSFGDKKVVGRCKSWR
jgi:hypothetical protein